MLVTARDQEAVVAVKPVPEGYHTVTPYVVARGAARLLDFLGAAFGAQEYLRVPNPDGTIGHAEVRIGDSVVMVFDAEPDWPDTPATLRLYVDDADAVYARALAAGARSITDLADTFYGDRGGRLVDPFGNIWWIQSHVEDVDPAEIAERAAAWQGTATDPGRHAERTLDRELRGRSPRPGSPIA